MMINALEPPLTSAAAATISKAVPISRESCKKSTWKTAGKSSINSVANTFPNHQCRKEKEEKKQRRGSSVAVLLTLLAFFAIQLLRESLKDPKEKSQETKAHLLLALNTKSTLLYQKNPLLLFLLELLKTLKSYQKINVFIIFQPGSSETEIIPLLCHLCTTAVSELGG